MSGPPPRKSALKGFYNTKTLRRSIGSRELVNGNGSAMVPRRRLMFHNTARIRPFDFRNTAAEVANASANTTAPLMQGKNARGYAPVIRPDDPRANPEFAEALGANQKGLRQSMARNREERFAGINRPTHNSIRASKLNQSRKPVKELMLRATQHEMGYPDRELNQLWFMGANDEYLNEERTLMKKPYYNHVQQNKAAAYRAAQINAADVSQIAAEASPKTRRARKTRRNRK